MRVTKAMKAYAEEQLNEARYAVNKAAGAAYHNRQSACEEEIKTFLEREVNPAIRRILEKYDMDMYVRDYGDMKPAEQAVLKLFSQNIRNAKEAEALRIAESKRYSKNRDMIDRFILECDLGCDREKFFKMIEEMKESVTAEG